MLDLLFPRTPAANASWGPLDPRWYGMLGSKTTSGAIVNENTALNYSAVWCATRILSETIAQLPLVMMKVEGKNKSRAVGHRLYRILHDQPNPEMDTVTFRDMLSACLINWGTAYAEIVRDGRGNIVELWPIHTSRIPPQNIKRDPETDEIYYLVRNDNGAPTEIGAADMLRIVGPLSTDGITGKGVVSQARESIGLGLETERFGASFFGNDARPSILLRPQTALSEKAAQNLRRSWNKLYQGTKNANRVGVLEENIAVEKLSVPPEDAQFLQTRQHNITEISRWYRVPPHMLADLTRATFSNIEHQGIDFVVYSLTPWLRRWEESLRSQLLTENEQQSHIIRFNVNGLLRGDAKARSEYYRGMAGIGVFSINEIRELEDMNPIEDGDEHYRPLNMVPVWQEVPLDVAKAAKPNREPSQSDEEDEDSTSRAAADQESRDVLKAAARMSLATNAGKMIYKESQAARRAAKEPKTFLAWLDDFYSKHQAQVAESIEPCVRVLLLAIGSTANATEAAKHVAGEHVKESYQRLLVSSEVASSKLAESVGMATCETWRNDAAYLIAHRIEELYGTETNPALEAAA